MTGMTFRLLLSCLFTACTLCAQEVTVPERPADYVLDQTGKVTTAERKAVVEAVRPVAEKHGLTVYLVLLNSAAEEPPADVARRLAQSWRSTVDTAVVLTAPDLNPPLLVEVAGEALGSLKEEDLRTIKAEAMAEAGKAGTGVPAMLAAAKSLGRWVQKLRTGEIIQSASAAPESKANATTYLSAWIAGGAILCCALALILMRRGRHHALIFPQTEPRRRFSAPHCGGNDAMTVFGKRPE